MKLNKIFILLIIIIASATFFIFQSSAIDTPEASQEAIAEESTIIKKLEITDGSTYGILMDNASVSSKISNIIFNAAEGIYDLSKIRIGRTLDLVYDKETNDFNQLVYQIDTEEELFVTRQKNASSTEWVAELILIPYEIRIKNSTGKIKSSMYEAALAQNIDERAIIELANAFQWSVDFALDVRVGDEFEFTYEERYRHGEYIMPGQILAGKYINHGTPYYIFYYEESEDNKGFFDQDGNSVQKIFLRAPLSYKYISSGFTTGLRYIKAFNVSTGHRAIDYAAAYGTPIRSVGDGTVTYAGWNGSYGNFVTVRHNGTYSTNYAHLSSFAVRSGQRVTQGQTIAYVGSSGFSTGPHLHYEMVKYGTKINPLTEVLPPGKAIKEENKADFFAKIKPYADKFRLDI